MARDRIETSFLLQKKKVAERGLDVPKAQAGNPVFAALPQLSMRSPKTSSLLVEAWLWTMTVAPSALAAESAAR
jgi:hypothetical protein